MLRWTAAPLANWEIFRRSVRHISFINHYTDIDLLAECEMINGEFRHSVGVKVALYLGEGTKTTFAWCDIADINTWRSGRISSRSCTHNTLPTEEERRRGEGEREREEGERREGRE